MFVHPYSHTDPQISVLIIELHIYIYNNQNCVSLWFNWASLVGLAGIESTYNAGDLGLIPGLERFLGEGKGYPL